MVPNLWIVCKQDSIHPVGGFVKFKWQNGKPTSYLSKLSTIHVIRWKKTYKENYSLIVVLNFHFCRLAAQMFWKIAKNNFWNLYNRHKGQLFWAKTFKMEAASRVIGYKWIRKFAVLGTIPTWLEQKVEET